ncbi:uncharacterized protein LOC111301876 [Durio zibethinus]|uniref:Uncharacterized protein LOC111301876 n=1 Tax=Durio zibethinus TaxID=66656 RepID=A0A6P5ZM44_DURZI|nr:uncharacterized protein LOC111301876 [Durio zibethinus]
MGNSLRCCLACVLPCGALDLIRIVHLNGYVEEIMGPVTAGEILKANPNHVLSKPCSQGVVRKILILSPESELKRGSIYFLIPSSSLLEKKKTGTHHKKKSKKCNNEVSGCDRYLANVNIAEKKCSSGRDRRNGRVGVWRPHLASISEVNLHIPNTNFRHQIGIRAMASCHRQAPIEEVEANTNIAATINIDPKDTLIEEMRQQIL